MFNFYLVQWFRVNWITVQWILFTIFIILIIILRIIRRKVRWTRCLIEGIEYSRLNIGSFSLLRLEGRKTTEKIPYASKNINEISSNNPIILMLLPYKSKKIYKIDYLLKSICVYGFTVDIITSDLRLKNSPNMHHETSGGQGEEYAFQTLFSNPEYVKNVYSLVLFDEINALFFPPSVYLRQLIKTMAAVPSKGFPQALKIISVRPSIVEEGNTANGAPNGKILGILKNPFKFIRLYRMSQIYRRVQAIQDPHFKFKAVNIKNENYNKEDDEEQKEAKGKMAHNTNLQWDIIRASRNNPFERMKNNETNDQEEKLCSKIQMEMEKILRPRINVNCKEITFKKGGTNFYRQETVLLAEILKILEN